MPKRKEYTGIGLLIYTAVQNLGMQRKEAAKKLNISESLLYKYFETPPKDIELLIKFSKGLGTNLLAHYKDREPLKGMLETKDKQIRDLEQEIMMLKKHNEQLNHTVDLQKEKLLTLKKSRG
jgi:hypothetical protein